MPHSQVLPLHQAPAPGRDRKARIALRSPMELQLQLPSLLAASLDRDHVLDQYFVYISLDLKPASIAVVGHGYHYRQGKDSKHQAHYQLKIDDQDLARLQMTRARPFSEAEPAWIEQTLSYLLLPLRHAFAYAQMQDLALHDKLTGVGNRRAFEVQGERLLKSALRHNRPCCLLLLDIDHFKRINDEHGHERGDLALVETAQRLNDQLRGSDLLCRWGGEEFIALLPETHLPGARIVAERIRHAFVEQTINGLALSVSIGLVSLLRDESLQELFHRADQALYRAKQEGRNRVCVDGQERW